MNLGESCLIVCKLAYKLASLTVRALISNKALDNLDFNAMRKSAESFSLSFTFSFSFGTLLADEEISISFSLSA